MKDSAYWAKVQRIAKELKSDGCTAVVDIYVDCCYEHDIHYRTHLDLDGAPISRARADQIYRKCMQDKSWMGVFSIVSWGRWIGTRLLARAAWNHD